MGKRYDILRIDPQDDPIYILVPAFDPERGKEGLEYYYEEHSCPRDFISSAEEIFIEGDHDPHGLISYVRTTDEVIIPAGGFDPSEFWPTIIPEAFSKKES